MAKHLLLKLDAKMKAAKAAPVETGPVLCPVCGFDVRAGSEHAAEEEEILVRVEEDMRASRASRRPPPTLSGGGATAVPRPASPRAASPPAARPAPRTPRGAAAISAASAAATTARPPLLTRLPPRAVFVLIEALQSGAARQSLALANREWASNVRFWAGPSGRATRLALCLKNEEVDYCRGLGQLRAYQRELDKARAASEDESQLLFANAETLLRLSSILLRDLHDRFTDWKAGDSVCDVFLIAVQGLRVYATYYANYEVMLPGAL